MQNGKSVTKNFAFELENFFSIGVNIQISKKLENIFGSEQEITKKELENEDVQ